MIAVLAALALLIVCIAAACSGMEKSSGDRTDGGAASAETESKEGSTQQKGSLRTVQGPQAYQTHPPVQDRQAYQISQAYQASTAEQAVHHLKVPDHPMEMPHQAAQVHPEVPMFMTGQRRPPPYTTTLRTRPFITML